MINAYISAPCGASNPERTEYVSAGGAGSTRVASSQRDQPWLCAARHGLGSCARQPDDANADDCRHQPKLADPITRLRQNARNHATHRIWEKRVGYAFDC